LRQNWGCSDVHPENWELWKAWVFILRNIVVLRNMDDLVDLGMPNFSKPRWLGQNSPKTGGFLNLVGGGTVPKSLGDN
jgi:hypothetical protein